MRHGDYNFDFKVLRFVPNIKKKFKKVESVRKEIESKSGSQQKSDFKLLQKMLQSHSISNDRLAQEQQKANQMALGKRSKCASRNNSEKLSK